MSLFVGARVGIGRELSDNCSHQELLCDLAGIQPTCLFAFSYLWSELHAVFNQELDGITISQALEMLETQTPAVFLGKVPQEHPDPMSDFQVALLQQNVAPKLALRVVSNYSSLAFGSMELGAVQAAQQLQQSKRTFVKSAAEIIGSRDLLLSNWFQRMGGRVLAAVTGGGHTSEEVLSWMQVLVSAWLVIFVAASSCLRRPFLGSRRLNTRIRAAYGKTRTVLRNFPA
jgi:long-subunit acyl-CoA synthetase (AMP-forming)